MKAVLLALHITGGAVAIITGFTAMFVGKGSTLHRWSGDVFVIAMMTLGISGALLGNYVGGLLAAYMAGTAWTTLRPVSRRENIAIMMFPAVGGLLLMYSGFATIAAGHSSKDGVPVGMTLFLGTVMLFAAAGDFRLIRADGVIRGSKRIVRHLWRMCFSLFIASGSFFTIRKRVAMILPDPFLDFRIRLIPVILPFLAIGYWLWKIKFRKTFRPVRIRDAANA